MHLEYVCDKTFEYLQKSLCVDCVVYMGELVIITNTDLMFIRTERTN